MFLKSLEYGTFEEAERWHEHVEVKPWAAMAMALHANHPEPVQIEAEYDINFDGEPVYAGLYDDFFINEAIYHE